MNIGSPVGCGPFDCDGPFHKAMNFRAAYVVPSPGWPHPVRRVLPIPDVSAGRPFFAPPHHIEWLLPIPAVVHVTLEVVVPPPSLNDIWPLSQHASPQMRTPGLRGRFRVWGRTGQVEGPGYSCFKNPGYYSLIAMSRSLTSSRSDAIYTQSPLISSSASKMSGTITVIIPAAAADLTPM